MRRMQIVAEYDLDCWNIESPVIVRSSEYAITYKLLRRNEYWTGETDKTIEDLPLLWQERFIKMHETSLDQTAWIPYLQNDELNLQSCTHKATKHKKRQELPKTKVGIPRATPQRLPMDPCRDHVPAQERPREKAKDVNEVAPFSVSCLPATIYPAITKPYPLCWSTPAMK